MYADQAIQLEALKDLVAKSGDAFGAAASRRLPPRDPRLKHLEGMRAHLRE